MTKKMTNCRLKMSLSCQFLQIQTRKQKKNHLKYFNELTGEKNFEIVSRENIEKTHFIS